MSDEPLASWEHRAADTIACDPATMAVAHRLLSAGACDARAPFVRTTARPGGAIRASDRAESEAEGKLKGRIEGTAEAVVAVLAARGLVLDRGERDRILGERDPARLARWLAGAITCRSAAELLAMPIQPRPVGAASSR